MGDDACVVSLGRLPHGGSPNDDRWEIGSITKVFTAVLLAEMTGAGDVALEHPIGRYLPDSVASRLPSEPQQPTLEDLATHTAGLPSLPLRILPRGLERRDPYSELTEADVFGCLGPRTRRPHRARFRYSNFGVGLLGHLLARAAARPYDELLTERLLVPLGLMHTGVASGGDRSPVVQGYRRGRPTPPWTFGALAGCGALRSTVGDLLCFMRACLQPP
ncbi:MAG: beta-lactamase family protein, partial [Actinomycetota bacterium]|nr:beta-lactamase family protein [Actinomycetota bacterium]